MPWLSVVRHVTFQGGLEMKPSVPSEPDIQVRQDIYRIFKVDQRIHSLATGVFSSNLRLMRRVSPGCRSLLS